MHTFFCGVLIEIKIENEDLNIFQRVSKEGRDYVLMVLKNIENYKEYLTPEFPLPCNLFLNPNLVESLTDILKPDLNSLETCLDKIKNFFSLDSNELESLFDKICGLFGSGSSGLSKKLINLDDEIKDGLEDLNENAAKFIGACYFYYHDLFTDSFIDRNGVAFDKGATTNVTGLLSSAAKGSSIDKKVSAEVVSIIAAVLIELIFDDVFKVPINYQKNGGGSEEEAKLKFTSYNAGVIAKTIQESMNGSDYSKLVGVLVAKAASKSASEIKSAVGIAAKGAWAGSANNETLSELVASAAGSIAKKISEALAYYTLNALISALLKDDKIKFKIPFGPVPGKEYNSQELLNFIQKKLIH